MRAALFLIALWLLSGCQSQPSFDEGGPTPAPPPPVGSASGGVSAEGPVPQPGGSQQLSVRPRPR